MMQEEHSGPSHRADRLRVLIADDDPLARRIVRDGLQKRSIVVVAEAANGHDAVDLAVHYEPELVLIDIAMQGSDGIAAMREIIARCPQVRVVVFSVAFQNEVGVQCLRDGASGYLTKDIDLEMLPQALRGVVQGEIACPRLLVKALIHEIRSTPDGGIGLRPVKSALTPREWEVLDHLCRGMSTDAMADHLSLSTETVRSHVKNLLRKLGVRSRQEAVALAPTLRMPQNEPDGVGAR